MNEIKRVLIWNGWARVGHWSIAISSLVLIITGLLLKNSPVLAKDAIDYHYFFVPVLMLGLAIRLVLFIFDKKHLRLLALIPSVNDLNGIKQMLLFYLSLGKQPLPNWYAHNPIWKPVYIVWYLSLILLLASGLQMPDSGIVFSFYPPSIHRFWADIVLWLSILHSIALFMHDYRGNADVSGMINGYRTFEIKRDDTLINKLDIKVKKL